MAAGLEPLEFRLGPPQTVRGRVVDAEGKPVAGTLVVTDSWRGYRTLDIRTETDADGRFTVADLPDEPVEFQFAREGYMNLPNQRLTAEEEAVVTLTRPLIIRGTVTDAKTGQPVDRFTIYESSGPDNWDRERPRPSRGGRYEFSASWPYPVMRALRVEAKEYMPATSRSFAAGEGEVTYDFKLNPGTVPTRPAVTGVVLLPDDTPAADAEVALASKSFAPYVSNGSPSHPRRCPIDRTGRDGTFRFEPQNEPVAVMAFHDRGFAEATESELEALPGHALRLVEWGRVVGILRIGAGPGAKQQVNLDPKRAGAGRDGKAHIDFGYQTQTDDQGRFVFERVVPGPASISRVVPTSPHSSTFGRWFGLDVPRGATAKITIGGTGRPVVGRVVVPRGGKLLFDPTAIRCSFRLLPPPVGDPSFFDQTMPRELRRTWYQHWILTEEGKAYLAYQEDRRFYGFAVQRDGSFRIDDVIPGAYELTLRVLSAPAPPGSPPAAEAKRAVTIDPIPGGRSDVPLDLGRIELVPQP